MAIADRSGLPLAVRCECVLPCETRLVEAMLTDTVSSWITLGDYFHRWHSNRVTTVERIIGRQRSTGVNCTRHMLEVELSPELWHLRGDL